MLSSPISSLTHVELTNPLVRVSVSDRALDVTLALILIALTAPLMLGIALLVLIVDGRPIFYRGRRLGRGLRTFEIVKFRTLEVGAEQRLGGQLLTERHALKTRTGNFLRESRLDELPQLFNVLLGDMTFLGPRPERWEVYTSQCWHIPGYERRFQHKPGLIGYSQVFTPHGTPKALRVKIDNQMLGRASTWETIRLVVFTGWCVQRSAARRAMTFLGRGFLLRTVHGVDQRRRLARHRHRHAYVRFMGSELHYRVLDANEGALALAGGPAGAPLEGIDFELVTEIENRTRVRLRRARCRGRLRAARPGSVNALVYDFEPLNDKSRYVVEQYLLRKSVAWRR